MRLFIYLLIAFLAAGCNNPKPTPEPTTELTPSTSHEFHFELPPGWTDDTKTMEGRPDLYAIQSADGQGKAFGMPFDLQFEASEQTEKPKNDLSPRLMKFLLAFEEAMPKRYEGWKLIRRGGIEFQGKLVGEIVFTGRDTTKEVDEGQRWRRILVMLSPDTENRLILLGFGAPIGHEGDYQEAFESIEKSWRWN